MKSIELENLEDARYLLSQSRILYGSGHATTRALESVVDFWFESWCKKETNKNYLSNKELDEQAIEALHMVVVAQQQGTES